MPLFKKLLSLILAVMMLLSLVACGKETTPEETIPVSCEYTVQITSQGGMAIGGIDVYIYDGDALAGFGQTDETGTVAATLPQKENYRITMDRGMESLCKIPQETDKKL